MDDNFHTMQQIALRNGGTKTVIVDYNPLEFGNIEGLRKDVEELKKSIKKVGLINKAIIVAEFENNQKMIIDGKKRQQAIKELITEGHELTNEIKPMYLAYRGIPKTLAKLLEFVAKRNTHSMNIYERAKILTEYQEQGIEKGRSQEEITEEIYKYFGIKDTQFNKYLFLNKVRKEIRDILGEKNISKSNYIEKILKDSEIEPEKVIETINNLSELSEEELKAHAKMCKLGIKTYKSKSKVLANSIKMDLEFKNKELSEEEKKIVKKLIAQLEFKILTFKEKETKELIDEKTIYEMAANLIQNKGYFLEIELEENMDISPVELFRLGFKQCQIEGENGEQIEGWSFTEKKENTHDKKLRFFLEENYRKKLKAIKYTPRYGIDENIYNENDVEISTRNYRFRFLKILKFKNEYETFKRVAVIPDAVFMDKLEEVEEYTFFEYEYSKKLGQTQKEVGYLEYIEGKLKNYILLYSYILYSKNKERKGDPQAAFFGLGNMRFNVNVVYNSERYKIQDVQAIKEHLNLKIEELNEKFNNEFAEVIRNIKFNIIRF